MSRYFNVDPVAFIEEFANLFCKQQLNPHNRTNAFGVQAMFVTSLEVFCSCLVYIL